MNCNKKQHVKAKNTKHDITRLKTCDILMIEVITYE